tara:strand:+ start:225 stop:758 length:534 start_codon:yes stop_codon:yes gene_type:complete
MENALDIVRMDQPSVVTFQFDSPLNTKGWEKELNKLIDGFLSKEKMEHQRQKRRTVVMQKKMKSCINLNSNAISHGSPQQLGSPGSRLESRRATLAKAKSDVHVRADRVTPATMIYTLLELPSISLSLSHPIPIRPPVNPSILRSICVYVPAKNLLKIPLLLCWFKICTHPSIYNTS